MAASLAHPGQFFLVAQGEGGSMKISCITGLSGLLTMLYVVRYAVQ